MSSDLPDNTIVQPLLTDLYQITMAYGYWKSGKENDYAVFDLFFRKNPFQGEFTIFAGLDQCLKFLKNFKYAEADITYIKTILPVVEEEFLSFLKQLTTRNVALYAVEEGTVVFPKIPLIRIEGPLILLQLLETTFLTLVNYASLITTNAARYRIAAGTNVSLLEFGLRRAQGPDGGLSASKYAYVGGFDGTSNVLAGKMFGIPVEGTHAHAYISSFNSFQELKNKMLWNKNTGNREDLLEASVGWKKQICSLPEQASEGELAAFVSYALAFPDRFVALLDTYDVCKSGLVNFCAVALALNDFGYEARGVRLDSGDLAYLSQVARKMFLDLGQKYGVACFAKLRIMASSDINEETLISLNEQKHQMDTFGIGTHLVTCHKQPALGCVYKLVELNYIPRIKLSQDVQKMTMPGRKDCYRLFGGDDYALCDLLQRSSEPPPCAGEKPILCRHPYNQQKRAYASPTRVESLLKLYWKDGKYQRSLPTLDEIKNNARDSLKTLRQDHKRYLNPTPYKVSVSEDLYTFFDKMWMQNAPIGELR